GVPAPFVWIAAKRDVFAHGHWKDKRFALGHHGHAAREGAPVARRAIQPLDANRTRHERQHAQECTDQRALPAAIGPHDRGDPRGRHDEADVVHGRPGRARIACDDLVEAYHEKRRSCTRKNGTPTSAVTAPSGSSAGGCAVRATRSASTTSAAPVSAAPRSSGRCCRIPAARTRCGTTSPTNPTSPAAATVAAA